MTGDQKAENKSECPLFYRRDYIRTTPKNTDPRGGSQRTEQKPEATSEMNWVLEFIHTCTHSLSAPSPWLHMQLSSALTFTTRSWKMHTQRLGAACCTGATSLHTLLTWGEAGPRACLVLPGPAWRAEASNSSKPHEPHRKLQPFPLLDHPHLFQICSPSQVKQTNARLHKICRCISCGLGSLLPRCSQHALLSLQAQGGEEQGGRSCLQCCSDSGQMNQHLLHTIGGRSNLF